MRALILIAAILVGFWSQDTYHDGNVVGAGALLLFAVLIVYVCGYLLGLETGEETVVAEPDEDEPKVGGTG